jgi:ribosomal protein L40E
MIACEWGLIAEGIPVGLFRQEPADPLIINDYREKTEKEEDEGLEAHIRCRQCHASITSGSRVIQKNGSHEHTFFNPHGIVFRIGCFSQAPGCLVNDRYTGEFSWFASHLWTFAICRQCYTHLGWHFRGESGSFYGLIFARLEE